MEKNRKRLETAINALLAYETDDEFEATHVISIIEMLEDRVENLEPRTVKEWRNG